MSEEMSQVCWTHWVELQTGAEILKGKHVSQDNVTRICSATRLFLRHLGSDLHEKFCKFGNVVRVVCPPVARLSVKAKCYSASVLLVYKTTMSVPFFSIQLHWNHPECLQKYLLK